MSLKDKFNRFWERLADKVSGVTLETRILGYSFCPQQMDSKDHPNYASNYKVKSRTGLFVLVESGMLNGVMTYTIQHVSTGSRLVIEDTTFNFLFKVA